MDILKQSHNIAVIGVTQNTEKFGYKIYKRLKQLGYKTYGISPIYKEIEGDLLYTNLKSIPDKIDLIVFVTNPKFTIDYINEGLDLNIEHYWFQPHTYTDEIIELLENNHKHHYEKCVLVETQEQINE